MKDLQDLYASALEAEKILVEQVKALREENQRLKAALADTEALEISTSERCAKMNSALLLCIPILEADIRELGGMHEFEALLAAKSVVLRG